MATIASQPSPSSRGLAQIASSWSRASSGSIATIGRWVRSSRSSPSVCIATCLASTIASVRNSSRRPMLVDRDQAEAARRERIAEHRVDPRGHARRPARRLGQDQVARLGVLEVGDRQLAPLLLSTGVRKKRSPSLRTTPSTSSAERGELLHDMGDMPLPRLLGAGEDAVVERQRRPPPALDHAQLRRRRVGMPALRLRPDLAVVDRDDAQHRHPGTPPALWNARPGALSISPSSAMSLSRALSMILSWPDSPNARAISRLPAGWPDWFDEVEDLLAGRQAGRWFAGHEAPNWARRSPPTMLPAAPVDVRARR